MYSFAGEFEGLGESEVCFSGSSEVMGKIDASRACDIERKLIFQLQHILTETEEKRYDITDMNKNKS